MSVTRNHDVANVAMDQAVYRVSYLVPSLEAIPEKAVVPKDHGNSLEIKGLAAAKHLRVTIPQAAPPIDGPVHIDWARDVILDTPFDLPYTEGLRVTADISTDAEKLREWAWSLGLSITPFSTESFYTYTSLEKPNSLLGFNFSEASAVKISWGSEENPGQQPSDLIIEIFEPHSVRTEHLEQKGTRTEVGLLALDPMSEPDDIVVLGRVRDLGINEISKPFMFHHVPRFRSTPNKADSKFPEPYGLHPPLDLRIYGDPPSSRCKLYTLLDLPPSIIVDKYQLEDLMLVEPAAQMLGVWGETDLEAPDWLVGQGSELLIKLTSGASNYSIPLHLRYGLPSASSHAKHTLPAPLVFWSCQDSTLKAKPPIGLESWFPEDTAFYIIKSNSIDYRVPTIDPQYIGISQITTAVVVVIGTLAIIWSIMTKSRALSKKKVN